MNNKYISTENFEIIETPQFFEVDELIAETISILNKKGYKTLFSCAGHNEKTCYKVTCGIDLLDEIKKDKNNYIGKINKYVFEYYRDTPLTSTYIKFDDHYNFASLPEEFEYETEEEFENKLSDYYILIEENKKDIVASDSIVQYIEYFEGDKRLDDAIIEEKIKTANDVLLQWAKNLPDVKNN